MNLGKTIFAQLIKFLPIYEFRQCIQRYQGTYKVQTFSCWDQFLCMAFAQLTYRESLRDIEVFLRPGQEKPTIWESARSKVSRNTLAYTNPDRDWRIYPELAHVLIPEARCVISPRQLRRGTGSGRLCARFYPHRFMSFISLGQLSQTQRSHKTAQPPGSTRKHPFPPHHYPWKGSRCHDPRSAASQKPEPFTSTIEGIWILVVFLCSISP